jgi:hypothetical protein
VYHRYFNLYFTTATILEWKYLLQEDNMKDVVIESLRFPAAVGVLANSKRQSEMPDRKHPTNDRNLKNSNCMPPLLQPPHEERRQPLQTFTLITRIIA